MAKAIGLILSAWILLPTSGWAETVILKLHNGDRITGKLLSETVDHVVLRTTWAKELTIPATEISQREILAKPPLASPPTKTAPAKAATVKTPAIKPSTNVVAVLKTNALASVKPASAPKAKLLQAKSWRGKMDVGMNLGFGQKDRQLYYGKLKVVYLPVVPAQGPKTISSRFKNTFDYSATYGKTERTVSANRMEGAAKTDFDLHQRVFVYNLLSGGHDQIRKIDFEYEVGPGLGYHLLTRSNLVLNTEIGMIYQEQTFAGKEKSDRFFVRLAEDFTWSITKRMLLEEKFEMFPGVNQSDSLRMRAEISLRYALWQNVALTFSALDSYDTEPAPNVPKNDLQIRSMIGISF